MNETINYDSLLILSVVAFFTPFLVSRLKRVNIPYQVGEIFIGILLGKRYLDFIFIKLRISLFNVFKWSCYRL